MLSRIVPAISLVCISLALAGCHDVRTGAVASAEFVTDQPARIQLSGSSTIGPLAMEIGKRYEDLHPHIRVDVLTGGSSRGIADASNGLVDIGMSSRGLNESEQPGQTSWPIAIDGVCFIVNKNNSVRSLSRSQLKSILLGQLTNWSEVGGLDQNIVFVDRAAGRSEVELVTAFFNISAEDMDADLIAGENQQGIKMVANSKNAISYMSVGAGSDAAMRGSQIALLPLEEIKATVANVESGKFPLSRPLLLVTPAEPKPVVREFIEYAQSAKVSDLVREQSYVPIKN